MNLPYTVALRASNVAPADRISAEIRYIQALESVLGGPHQVKQVHDAWTAASERRAEELDAWTLQLAVRWPRGTCKARQAGLTGIQDAQDAEFVVTFTSAQLADAR